MGVRRGISRARARVSIVLMVLSVAAILVGAVRTGWWLTLAAAGLLVVSMLVKPWKCPTCGKSVSFTPQWSEPGKVQCPFCTSRLAYDDEEDTE